jgi:hypothetical protein
MPQHQRQPSHNNFLLITSTTSTTPITRSTSSSSSSRTPCSRALQTRPQRRPSWRSYCPPASEWPSLLQRWQRRPTLPTAPRPEAGPSSPTAELSAIAACMLWHAAAVAVAYAVAAWQSGPDSASSCWSAASSRQADALLPPYFAQCLPSSLNEMSLMAVTVDKRVTHLLHDAQLHEHDW